jgi:hypothetical protein
VYIFKDLAQISASSLSMKIFRRCYLNKQISSSPKEVQYSEREAYYGGMTITLKRELKSGYYYDINSSYPSSMCKKMPVEYIGVRILEEEIKITSEDENTLLLLDEGKLKGYYLYFCKFKFNKDVKIRNLPIKTKTQTEYPIEDNIIRPRWGIELKEALKSGCEIVIYKYNLYRGEAIFADFVNDIYAKRLESKNKQKLYKKDLELAKTEEEKVLIKNKISEQTSLIDFWKSILNNLYGKTGQKIYDRNILGNLTRVEEVIKMKNARITNMNWLNHYEPEAEEIYLTTYHTDHHETEEIGSLVRFASYITACSRSKLISSSRRIGFEHCIYFDTDSIFSDVPFPDDMISDTELGKWKLEGKVYNGIYCGNKTYTYTKYENTNKFLIPMFEIENYDKINNYGLCRDIQLKLLSYSKETKEQMLKEYGDKDNPNIVLKSKGINKNLMCYQDYVKMREGETINKTNNSQFFKRPFKVEVRKQEKQIKMTGKYVYDEIKQVIETEEKQIKRLLLEEEENINRLSLYDVELLTEIIPDTIANIKSYDIDDDFYPINNTNKHYEESDLESDEYLSDEENKEDNKIILKELEKEDKKIHKKENKFITYKYKEINEYEKEDEILLQFKEEREKYKNKQKEIIKEETIEKIEENIETIKEQEIEEEELPNDNNEDFEIIQFLNKGVRLLK